MVNQNLTNLKERIKEIKKELKVIWNAKEIGWQTKYGELKEEQKKLEKEIKFEENKTECIVYEKCELFGCKIPTNQTVIDLPEIFFKSDEITGVSTQIKVSYKKVEKCSKCVDLSDEEIAEIKKYNARHSEIVEGVDWLELKKAERMGGHWNAKRDRVVFKKIKAK